jgi:sensor histidine kinase regulating citrate/malate metabolism
VTVQMRDDTLVLRVADSGPGMDAETFAAATRRGYSTKNDPDHHGLGLALVSQIVNRHNGSLSTDVTYGSVVTVEVAAP